MLSNGRRTKITLILSFSFSLLYYRVWEQQEDNFHLNQAKLRSTIRIEDGRAKPIDLLAKYVSAEDEDLSVELHEPYTYLNVSK